ncbi:N-alpha-acetyltransferase 25, NatB auxiliary subunit [Lobulomyces angularis]|nr:N-alpha-acetyltransferase 25, NatB auxiliary subunit [Lobulomyces angularis]
MYAKACEKFPKSQEKMINWYMSTIRSEDLNSQHQVAVKLNKTFSKIESKYYFWSVMTVFLQGKKNPKPNVYFTLAERMMQKAIEEKKVTDYQMIYLYISILLEQKKFEEVVKTLNSDLSLTLFKIEDDRLRLLELIYTKSGLFKESYDISLQMLRKSPDSWLSYQSMFESLFHLDSPDLNFTETFISEQQQQVQYPTRGPFLAMIDFFDRISKSDLKHDSTRSYLDLLISYVERVGDVYCCFDDLKPYLFSLSFEDSKTFLQKVEEFIKKDDQKTELKTRIKNNNILVNYLKFERFFFTKFTLENTNERETIVLKNIEKLFNLYQNTLKFGAKNLDKENHFGDDFLILIVFYLIDLFEKDKESLPHYLFQAISILEYGLKRSLYNIQFKLLLIRLYYKAGVFVRPITNMVVELDIKQTLLESIGWVYIEGLEYLASGKKLIEASKTFNGTLAIYVSSEKETPDMILEAFQYGTYSKIEEFMEFRANLKNSLQKFIYETLIFKTKLRRIVTFTDPDNEDELKFGNLEGVKKQTYENVLENFSHFFENAEFGERFSDDFIESRVDNRDKNIFLNWSSNAESIATVLNNGEVIPDDKKHWLKFYGLLPITIKKILTKTEDWKTFFESNFQNLDVPKELITNFKILHCIVNSLTLMENSKQNDTHCDYSLQDILTLLDENLTSNLDFENYKNISFDFFKECTLFLDALMYACIGYIIFKSRNWLNLLTTKSKQSKAGEQLIKFARSLREKLTGFELKLKKLRDKLNSAKEIKIRTELFEEFTPCFSHALEFIGENVAKHYKLSWLLSLNGLIFEIEQLISILK